MVPKLNNEEYWNQRAMQRIISAEKKILRFENDLKEQFEKAYKEIESKIAEFYFKYAEDNGLEYADAVKYLTDNERKEFQKDLQFYIEKAQDNSFRTEHKQYLQALSTRARIERLEKLKASIKHEAHELYEEYISHNTQITFDDILKDNYYHTVFDIQQFLGYGVSLERISKNTLKALLEYPWSGSNYSDKIWGNVQNFSRKLENTLTSGIIQGKSNQEMARELRKATESSYKDAIRLIRTETNFIASEATDKAYGEYGIDEYQFLATLDLRTSETCRKLDRQVFKRSERIVGVNCNPMHPHCRSTTVPYIPDLEGTRLAKGSDGKYYEVDRNMSYKEWYEKYVANDPNELRAEKMIKMKSSDKRQYEKYKSIVGKSAPKTIEDFQYLKYNNVEGWNNLKAEYRIKNYIHSDKQVKKLNIGQQNKHIVGTNEYKQYVSKLMSINQHGPSIITISEAEIEALIKKYSGTGIVNIKNGKWDKKETILDNDIIVGNAVNNITGKQAETTVFKIHYSKEGVHIVPDYPSKKRVKK